MNHGIKHISIPKPCTQNWADMDVAEQGRFCQSCQKTVTDFTKLSSGQILEILSSSGKLCGRLNETQLQGLNNTFTIQQAFSFSWKKFSIAAAFIGFVPFVKAEGKGKPETYQNSVEYADPLRLNKVIAKDSVAKTYVIAGKVLDSRDNSTLVGATIEINGNFVTADVDGNFKMVLSQLPEQFVCKTKFIGFKNKEVSLNRRDNNSRLIIKMDEAAALMGEVVIKRPPLWKRPYYAVRRLIHKIFS